MTSKKHIFYLVLAIGPFILGCGGTSSSSQPELNTLGKVELATINYDGDVISWSAVDNAMGYEVQINNGGFISVDSETEYPFISPTNFDVKIKALGDPLTHNDSISEVKTFEKLPDLTIDQFTFNFPSIAWTSQSNVSGYEYELKTNNVVGSILFTSQSTINGFNASIRYEIRLRSMRNDSSPSKAYFSKFSPFFAFEFLTAPEATFNAATNQIQWEPVSNASQYLIEIIKEGLVVNSFTRTNTQDNFVPFEVDSSGEFTITIQANANPGNVYKASAKRTYQLLKLETPEIAQIQDLPLTGGSRLYFSEIEQAESMALTIDGVTVSAQFNGTSSQFYVDYGFGTTSAATNYYQLSATVSSTNPWVATSNSFNQELVQLARPTNITIVDNQLIWQNVNQSFGYIVSINNLSPYVIESNAVNTFDFLSYFDLDAGAHLLRMQSRGDGLTTLSSFFSSSISLTRLSAPTLNEILDGSLQWSPINQAFSYGIVYSTGLELESLTTQHTIEVSSIETDTVISVFAKGDGTTLVNSKKSETPILNRLAAVMLSSGLSTQQSIQWDENPATNQYRIVITHDGQESYYDVENNDFNWSELDISEGNFTLQVIALGNGVNQFDSPLSSTLNFSRLAASSLSTNSGLMQFEWTEVENSTGFQLSIATLSTLNLSSSTLNYKPSFISSGLYEVTLIVTGNGTQTINSLPTTLIHEVIQLNTPSGSPVLTFSLNQEVLTATISNTIDGAVGYRFYVGDQFFDSDTTSRVLNYTNISGQQPFSVMALGNGFNSINSGKSTSINRLILENSALVMTPVNASFVQLNWTLVTGAASYLTYISKKSADGTITESPSISSDNTVSSLLIGITGFTEITVKHYVIGNGLSNFSSSGATFVTKI